MICNMKKSIFLFLFISGVVCLFAQTQPQIILQTGTNVRAFTSLDSTILAAVDGDIVFIHPTPPQYFPICEAYNLTITYYFISFFKVF